ncbi:hypothetical protein E4U55_002668 [Claviceps digitariae]|nr:hypothetical protein E4U55_002668 [Claviceps digitariae]
MSSYTHADEARLESSSTGVIYTNAAYFPSNRIHEGDTPAMLNYSCINRVYYAYAVMGLDGVVMLGDEWADAQASVDGAQGAFGSLKNLKHLHSHLQIILCVGGESCQTVYPVVASDALLRETFAQSTAGLLLASGFDGIDIAWEYPRSVEQGADFIALLAALRTYLPQDQYIITASLPVTIAVLQYIDFPTAANYLNHINLVAYDFFGEWTPKSGHHAQLYALSKDELSGSAGVEYMISRGFPPTGILLGVPTYGRSFLQVSGPGKWFTGAGGTEGIFSYSDLPREGCEEFVDTTRIAAYCVGGDGGFVSYDNPDTVQAKAIYVRFKMLGGLYYSSAPEDSSDPSRSLIQAGFIALHSSV